MIFLLSFWGNASAFRARRAPVIGQSPISPPIAPFLLLFSKVWQMKYIQKINKKKRKDRIKKKKSKVIKKKIKK